VLVSSVDQVVSTHKVSVHVIIQCNLDIIQGAVPLAMVPAIVFFAVPVVFICVSVCKVDPRPWSELVEWMCEVGVGADERCKCKLYDEVEARLMLRLQWA